MPELRSTRSPKTWQERTLQGVMGLEVIRCIDSDPEAREWRAVLAVEDHLLRVPATEHQWSTPSELQDRLNARCKRLPGLPLVCGNPVSGALTESVRAVLLVVRVSPDHGDLTFHISIGTLDDLPFVASIKRDKGILLERVSPDYRVAAIEVEQVGRRAIEFRRGNLGIIPFCRGRTSSECQQKPDHEQQPPRDHDRWSLGIWMGGDVGLRSPPKVAGRAETMDEDMMRERDGADDCRKKNRDSVQNASHAKRKESRGRKRDDRAAWPQPGELPCHVQVIGYHIVRAFHGSLRCIRRWIDVNIEDIDVKWLFIYEHSMYWNALQQKKILYTRRCELIDARQEWSEFP
jgi:hypothetical protein